MYAETGLVRFEYKHFAFLGAESNWAAEASECANEQGQFWPYHDVIYANQRGENQSTFTIASLKLFASALEMDESAFNSCLDSDKYRQAVEAEREEGQARGVQSTPTVYINGEQVLGAVPFEQLQEMIEAELSQQQ